MLLYSVTGDLVIDSTVVLGSLQATVFGNLHITQTGTIQLSSTGIIKGVMLFLYWWWLLRMLYVHLYTSYVHPHISILTLHMSILTLHICPFCSSYVHLGTWYVHLDNMICPSWQYDMSILKLHICRSKDHSKRCVSFRRYLYFLIVFVSQPKEQSH